MNTGLRVGDASRLRVDCLVHDGQGAPYLRYTNHKMRRDAFVPIDTDLAEAITAQQQAVLDRVHRTGLPAAAAHPQPGRQAAVQHRHVPWRTTGMAA